MIASRTLFDRTASRPATRSSRASTPRCCPIVAESCRIKAHIVEQDERESGLRRMLNFGHTAGHALEAVTKYRRFRHGEAVAYGMLAAAELAAARGVFPEADRDALAAQIAQLGPLPPVERSSAADIVEATKRDKKVDRRHAALRAADRRSATATTVVGCDAGGADGSASRRSAESGYDRLFDRVLLQLGEQIL